MNSNFSSLSSHNILRSISILKLLPPAYLAHAVCVCRIWRDIASDWEMEEMWVIRVPSSNGFCDTPVSIGSCSRTPFDEGTPSPGCPQVLCACKYDVLSFRVLGVRWIINLERLGFDFFLGEIDDGCVWSREKVEASDFRSFSDSFSGIHKSGLHEFDSGELRMTPTRSGKVELVKSTCQKHSSALDQILLELA